MRTEMQPGKRLSYVTVRRALGETFIEEQVTIQYMLHDEAAALSVCANLHCCFEGRFRCCHMIQMCVIYIYTYMYMSVYVI